MAPVTHRRTRILWLIKGLGPGGAERLLVNHARRGDHDRFAYEVAYVVPAKSHHVADLEAVGVRVHRPPPVPEAPDRWSWRLGRLIAERRPAIVHAHSPAIAPVARVASRLTHDVASVYTEHNRWPVYRPLTRAANAVTLGLDRYVLAVSDDVRRSMGRRWRRQVEVLHHGVDVESLRTQITDRAAVRAAVGVPADAFVAVCVANLRVEKDHENLLQAVRSLPDDDGGQPFRLLLVGQGPLQDEIAGRVKELGLDDRVLVLGQRNDVAAILGAADAFVLGSRNEGLPVAVMEALALGVPVVATSAGGVPEAVRTGIEGLLVPARSPAALARAIERVRSDPALRGRLARAAAARGQAFESAVAVRRVETIYEAVASRQAVEPPAPDAKAPV